MMKLVFWLVLMALIVAAGIFYWYSNRSIDPKLLAGLYGAELKKPTADLNIFHLGHSLVGRDMPAMLQQLRGGTHDYHSQLGWGATLQSHWDPEVPINGFSEENDHPRYQDLMEAIDTRTLDALVVTEMVEIKDAIKYFDSYKYLAKLTQRARGQNSATLVYFYETWHEVDDKQGWLNRLDSDYQQYWIGKIVDKALVELAGEAVIYLIPVGQVMSAIVKRTMSEPTPGFNKAEDLFRTTDEGTLDTIHLNDVGSYLVALVHYSVLYQESPVGLPYQLKRADGTEADAPSAETARMMQEVAWEVVSSNPRTGVSSWK